MKYTFGEKLRFAAKSRGRRFLESGWSNPEPGHCWSDGPKAGITVPLSHLPTSDVVLRVLCHGYRPKPGAQSQEVRVSANGRFLGAFEAGDPAWHEVKVPRSCVDGRQLALELEFPRAVSPSALGVSTDTRQLGISLDTMIMFANATPSSPGANVISKGADPMGDVFLASGSYHRAIRRDGRGSDVFKLATEKGIYQKLAKKGLIPEHVFRATDDPEYEAMASTVTGRSVYPPKYPWAMFKDAAHAWIDINKILYDESDGALGLCDGHYGNFVQCDNARPKWCDIGSVVDREGAIAGGYAEFVRCFILPLALATLPRKDGFNIRQMMVIHRTGMPIAQAVAEHGEALERIGLDEGYAPGQRRAALDRLGALIDSFELQVAEGYWSGYRHEGALENAWQGHLLRPNHDRRFAKVAELAASCDVDSFLDIGCNDGIFTVLCAREGMHGFGIEPDEQAINKLYAFAKSHPKVDLTISYGGFMDVVGCHPLVLLLALTHHLSITQKLTFEQIARQLARVSSQHVITEFMPDGLGGTRVNPQPVPNPLPPGYTLEHFTSALQAEFEHVRVIDYDRKADPTHMSRRILIHCQSPRR